MMGRRVLLSSLFVMAFVIAAAWQMPLSYVLRSSGLAGQGVSWQQARGTVWSGEVIGLGVDRTPLGAVSLSFEPTSALGTGAGHRFIWTSTSGRGQGYAALGGQRASVRAVTAVFEPAELAAGPGPLRSFPGRVRLADGAFDWTAKGCTHASGTLTTDILRLAGARAGQDWPDLTGPLTCKAGELSAQLQGLDARGVRYTLDVSSAGAITVTIPDADASIQAALSIAGFRINGNAFTYVQINR